MCSFFVSASNGNSFYRALSPFAPEGTVFYVFASQSVIYRTKFISVIRNHRHSINGLLLVTNHPSALILNMLVLIRIVRTEYNSVRFILATFHSRYKFTCHRLSFLPR